MPKGELRQFVDVGGSGGADNGRGDAGITQRQVELGPSQAVRPAGDEPRARAEPAAGRNCR